MDSEQLLTFAASVSYLTELLLLGLLVGTSLFTKDSPTPFRRFCALAMILDAAAILFSYTIVWDGVVSNYEGGLLNAIDGLILWAILSAGVRLMANERRPHRLSLLLGAPYLCLMAYHLCFAGHGLLQGQLAVLIVGIVEILYLDYRLLRYDSALKHQKSNIEYITTSWFGIFTLVVLCELLFWFVEHITNNVFGWTRVVYFLSLQCGYLVLARFAIRQQTTTLADLDEVPIDTDQPKSSTNSLAGELDRLMQESKLYCDPDLSLERLASELHTNSTYVYLCIHDDLGTTFYDYVNTLRIEEGKRLLQSCDDTIEGVAFNCGFNSSRSFQRTFKRITGCTPTEWRNNALGN